MLDGVEKAFNGTILWIVWSSKDDSMTMIGEQILNQWVVVMYQRVLSGNRDDQLGMHRVDLSVLLKDSRALLLILQAIVSMDQLTPTDGTNPDAWAEKRQLRDLAKSILSLEALHQITQKQRLSRSGFRSIKIASGWSKDDIDSSRLMP